MSATPKHDADCVRRRPEHPLLCTCGLSDATVARVRVPTRSDLVAERDKAIADYREFIEALTAALQAKGVPATPSWGAAIDHLARERDEAIAERDAAREALRDIATRPTTEINPDGDDQAAYTMQMIAREALTEGQET